MSTPLTNLHRFIAGHFDREELRTLCFNLGVDYDSLPSEGKAGKARELILWVGRRREFDQLLATLRQSRPDPFDRAGLSVDPAAVEALYVALPAFEAGAAPSRQRTEDHHIAQADRGGIAIVGDQNIIYQGVEVRIPVKDAVQLHRAALRAQLETDAQRRWGGMSVYIQEEGASLPIQTSPYQTGQLGPRQNLLQLLHTAGRLLVLGEPGTGKTVALERLAWELCEGSEPAVPVLIRLFHYAGAPLVEWVRVFLQKTGHLRLDDERALNAFLREGDARCFFLFDGLNEVPPPYRDRLVSELVRWMAAYPRHPVILTGRSQDELWQRLRAEVGQAVVVLPIGDEQAQNYLAAHLGERGQSLYGQLDRKLQELARTPLILWLIKEDGVAGEDVPGNRGELYASFVKRMLRRDTERRVDVEIPDRVKQDVLIDLAYHLGQEQRLSCLRDEAVEVAARRMDGDLGRAEQVIGTCGRHGLLAGEDEIWFAPHQTVQEHFAARALKERAEREWQLGRWERLRRAGRRVLTGDEVGLARLAKDDWWMETFVQLAGLVDDADRLAREVARVNPWLAWWCVEEGRGVEAETREMVETHSVQILESEWWARDRHRAVAALARMRSERAAKPLLGVAAGPGSSEVVGLAVQGLVELGEAARSLVADTLAGEDQHLWNAALHYLRAQPDDPLWAEIPQQMWDRLWDVKDRRRAVVSLTRMRSERAVKPLLRAAGDKDAEVAELAVQALVELGEVARSTVVDALDRPVPRERAAAGHVLAILGDNRDLDELVTVPAGPFLMGSSDADRMADENEKPQHEVTLPAFKIGKYPVTNAQYLRFVEATRHGWWDKGHPPERANQPAVGVSWYDARAYCAWLTEVWRTEGIIVPDEVVRLPTEAEWEKAARGSDSRRYPWGDDSDPKRANYRGTGVDNLSAVGCFPGGVSPYGCLDMAGNVWEWTQSQYKVYPYDPLDGRENLEAGDRVGRVLRGGAFRNNVRYIRCACRGGDYPDLRDWNRGFRVVAAPFSPLL